MNRDEAIKLISKIPCTIDEQEALRTLIPELRESEDERVREDILGGLMWQRDNLKHEGPHDDNLILPGFCLTVGEQLAYLEKQKEQKPSISIDQLKSMMLQYLQETANEKDDSDIEADTDKWAKKILGYDFEQKLISAEEVLAKAGLKPYKDGNQWCILAGDNIQEGICGFGDTIDEALYQFLMEVLEKQKEQNPINNSIREKIISRATSEKQVVLVSESSGNAEIGWDTRSLEDAKKLLEYGLAFINKQEQKLAPISCGHENGTEWSEEDEKIIRFYEADYNNQIDDMSMKDVIDMRLKFKNWLINRLKSLRPSWKPSEEQIKSMEFVIKNYREDGCIATANYLQEICDQIKKL